MISFEDIRRHSIERAISLGIKANNNLPYLDKTRVRNVMDVLNRINILHVFYAISLAGTSSLSFFEEMINKNKWKAYLTKKEVEILKSKHLSKIEKINLSWYKEDVFILLCCIGAINIHKPYELLEEIDISDYYEIIPPEKANEDFILDKELINEEEIFKMLDFYYYLHWRLKKEQQEIGSFTKLFRKNKYNLSVIMERRKALEWLSDTNLDWDNVSLDT